MVEHSLSAAQRRVGYALMAAIFGGMAWAACPGPPCTWWPRASLGPRDPGSDGDEDQGAAVASTAPGGGSGAVPVARSCIACHFQGGVGGGGDNRRAMLPASPPSVASRVAPVEGSIRSAAIKGLPAGPFGSIGSLLPVGHYFMGPQPGGNALYRKGRVGSLNPPALFGLGLVDRIPDRAIRPTDLRGPVDPRGSEPAGAVRGRPRILPDGRVGKFGWKAQYATLEEYLDAGCGQTGEVSALIKPVARHHAVIDPDRSRELATFVDALPRPVPVVPDSAADAHSARRGEANFFEVGCAACHTPNLGGLRGVYGDFLLHRLDDRDAAPGDASVEEPRVPPQSPPLAEEWRTAPLWGVADSAPYLHDGSAATLEEAIARHRGDAEASGRAYDRLGEVGRGDLVAFLRTLKAPVAASPASNMAAVTTERAAPQALRPEFLRKQPLSPSVL